MNHNYPSFCRLQLNRVLSCDSRLIARYSNLATKLIQRSTLFCRETSYLLSNAYSFNKVHSYSSSDLLLFFSSGKTDIAFVETTTFLAMRSIAHRKKSVFEGAEGS